MYFIGMHFVHSFGQSFTGECKYCKKKVLISKSSWQRTVSEYGAHANSNRDSKIVVLTVVHT